LDFSGEVAAEAQTLYGESSRFTEDCQDYVDSSAPPGYSYDQLQIVASALAEEVAR
jgi:hypothetical protein